MNFKKIGKRLLFLPGWLLCLLSAVSGAALVAVFVKGWENTVFAYVVFALSFYTLSVVCLYFAVVFPKRFGVLRKKAHENPWIHRYLTDTAFRTKVSLYLALAINLMYVGINLLSWHWNQSWWFVVLAVYYCVMAVMRFLLVRYVRKNIIGSSITDEGKRARACAYILLLINLSLSSAVLMILYRGRGYLYPGMTIYVMALYTFYSTIHSIVDIVKYRAMGSPVMSTAKIVSLSAALVSMLNLETAMFAQFGGDMEPEDQRLMIMLTGAGVSICVVTLSLLLIVKANKSMRQAKAG